VHMLQMQTEHLNIMLGALIRMIRSCRACESRIDATSSVASHRRRIFPAQAIWAFFEGLASALCLLKCGGLPDSDIVLPSDWAAICHLDAKPPNIFLAKPHSSRWPGIPQVKVCLTRGICRTGGTNAKRSRWATSASPPWWMRRDGRTQEACGVQARLAGWLR